MEPGQSWVLAILTLVAVAAAAVAGLKQARAANILTRATDRQIKGLERQTELVSEQVRLTKRQVEEGVRPLLFTPEGLFGQKRMLSTVKVMNYGNGPALDVRWFYGDIRPTPTHSSWLEPPLVASGKQAEVEIDIAEFMGKGLVFIYSSLAGNKYASVLKSSGQTFQYLQDMSGWIEKYLDQSPE